MNEKWKWMTTGLIVVSLFFSINGGVCSAEETITWKMAGVWGPGDAAYLPEMFAKLVAEKSNGRMKVLTYPAGQLYKVPEMFGALQKNLIQVSEFASGWWGSNIALYRLPDMPFLLKDNSEWRKWLENGLWDLWQQEAEKVGFKCVTMYGWGGLEAFSIYPIKTMEDAKGHKWRVHTPTLAAAVQALGGTPANIAINEVYQAMQRSVVDAAFAGVIWAYAFKWHEVAKYITKVDFGVPPQGIFINKSAYDALPSDLKKAVTDAGKELQGHCWDVLEKFMDKKWKAFKDEGNEVYVLPDAERDRWVSRVQYIWAEEAEKAGPVGLQAMEIYYKTFPNRRPKK